MLKFYPEQVAKHWDKISHAIENSLPPIADSRKAEDRMNGILASILAGKMEVHIFVVYQDERPIVYAITATAFLEAVDSENKELLLYSVYASRQLTRDIIYEGLELFRKYAKARGCVAVSGYTNIEGIKRLFASVGGGSSFTYLRLEV
jgi:esterase/lipase